MQDFYLRRVVRIAVVQALVVLGLIGAITGFAFAGETTTRFAGVKANSGTATHTSEDGRSVLTLSEDFVVPDTPDPHWQVIDSKGTSYLLERLTIKGDKVKRSITVPAYVPDVARVQIWCAFAETLLGEASFAAPVK
jgi:hypothetical protein